jgi:hypothetical protein
VIAAPDALAGLVKRWRADAVATDALAVAGEANGAQTARMHRETAATLRRCATDVERVLRSTPAPHEGRLT